LTKIEMVMIVKKKTKHFIYKNKSDV